MDPDTDGDGYWDGWIGVYGVDHSEDVILYREHLQSGNGVFGPEAIPRQQGVHEVERTDDGGFENAATAVDIDGDGRFEHSNVHVGELQWGTSPRSSSDAPDSNVSLEVGFHEDAPVQVWEENVGYSSPMIMDVQRNYLLYDIEVTVTDYEFITHEDEPQLDRTLPIPIGGDETVNTPFSPFELQAMFGKFQTEGESAQYLLFTNRTTLSAAKSNGYVTGINLYAFGSGVLGDQAGLAVFDENLTDSPEVRSITMHEIAHSFQIGEADDNCQAGSILQGGEIYSGDPNDRTPERISNNQEWSIMKSGVAQLQQPGSYYVFSIEELFSIQYANTSSGPACEEIA